MGFNGITATIPSKNRVDLRGRKLNSNMLCRDGRPWLVGGTPGGDRQVQWNVQDITLFITDAMLHVGFE